MIAKDHPCVRDCPDRFPGCNCEKLVAYKREKKEQKRLRRLANTVDDYQKDAVRKSKAHNIRRRHRI